MRTLIRSYSMTAGLFAIALAACASIHPLAAQAVKAVTVTITAPNVSLGSRTTATARVRLANGTYATNKPVAWGTSKPGVALVSTKGVVSTVTAGSASIVATVNGVVGQATLTVTPSAPAPPPPPPALASVIVSLTAPSITVGQATQATAIARDSGGDVLPGLTPMWVSLAPDIASVSSLGVVTGVSVGTATIRATIDPKHADVPITVAAAPSDSIHATDAELPRISLTTTVASTPSTGRTITVVDLQRALDTAVAGDKLVMACNATWSGNLTVRPAASGGVAGQWRTVTTNCTLPAEGTRTDTTQHFARILSPNVLPAIATSGAAAKLRFLGVEVTTSAATNQGLIALGCANLCETSTADQPSDIIFDRSYIHGTPSGDVRRCFGFNGARLAIVDSYVSECHSAFDAQAIAGWNGPGPFKISNNYLAGAAENVAFGGGDPSIANLVPSDIEITRNDITKPLTWQNSSWLVKNLLELKQGRRVLIEGNVFENVWPAGQNGLAFVLWSVNQQGTAPWSEVSNVTIRNNIIKNAAGVASLNVMGGDGNPALRAVPMNHLTIRNNVAIGLTGWRTFEITDTIASLVIEHNTAFNPGNSSFLWSSHAPLTNHVVRNNLVGGGQYQLFAPQGQGLTAWSWVAGPGSAFAGNVVVGFGGPNIPANWYPGAFTDLGLVGGGSAATSGSAALADLALSGSSAYHHAATDGTDIGADIGAVSAATAGVVVSPGARLRRP